MVNELTEGFIEPIDICPVFSGRFIGSNVFVFIVEPLRRIVRRVRKEYAIPNEERLFVLLRLFHKVDNRLHRFAPDIQPLVSVPAAARGIPVGHRISKAVIERRAFPPLAGLQGGVSVFLEQFDH